MTPLETAVRARLKESYKAIVGSRPEMDAAAVDQMVEEKASMVLPVLREAMDDNATPSLDRIHLAELEATKRQMRDMIGRMTDPADQAIKNAALRELDATPAAPTAPDLMADELERRMAELEKRLNGDVIGTPPDPTEK